VCLCDTKIKRTQKRGNSSFLPDFFCLFFFCWFVELCRRSSVAHLHELPSRPRSLRPLLEDEILNRNISLYSLLRRFPRICNHGREQGQENEDRGKQGSCRANSGAFWNAVIVVAMFVVCCSSFFHARQVCFGSATAFIDHLGCGWDEFGKYVVVNREKTVADLGVFVFVSFRMTKTANSRKTWRCWSTVFRYASR
jgi:hypothetical protein